MGYKSANWFWDDEKREWRMERYNYEHVHAEDKSGYSYKLKVIKFIIKENSEDHRWPWKMTYIDPTDQKREMNGQLDSIMDHANQYYWCDISAIHDSDMRHYNMIYPYDQVRPYVP